MTHNSITANECCKLLATYILKGYNSENIFNNIKNFSTDKNVNEIASGKYKEKYIDDIKSSGYCIHTLESAIWSVYNSKSFSEAILKAVNLGDDSDSVGAVTGQIAGALYGIDNIPSEWIDKLYRKEYLLDLGEKLYDLGQQN